MGYDRGWHLRGTSLWIDAERRRELCLLTGAEPRPPPLHRRVVASAPLAQALGRLGYGALVLPTPWERPLGIGGARIQLFDAGGWAGAAVVRAEVRADGRQDRVDATYVLGGLLRMAPVVVPPAAHFVARLPAVGHRGVPLRDVAIGIATAIANRTGGGAARIWVDHPEVGLAVLEEMAVLKHPLQPRGALAKWAAATDAAAAPPKRALMGTVALLPHLDPAHARPRTTAAAVAAAGSDMHLMIDSGIGGPAGVVHAPGAASPCVTFSVAYFADVAALRAAVLHTRARSVLLADVPVALESRVRQALAPAAQVKFLSDAQQLPLAQ